MSKNAEGVFTRLSRKLNLKLVFAFLCILVSLGLLGLSYKYVEPENLKSIAKALNTQCSNDSTQRCFKTFFSTFSDNHKIESSIELLNELKKINPQIRYCHSIAHVISIAEVKKDPKNWVRVFLTVPEFDCSYGFFHGAIEGKFQSDPGFIVGKDLINGVCTENGKTRSRGCSHAFGHILLVQETGDVKKAVEQCDSLLLELQEPCYQGVFMENISKDNLVYHAVSKAEVWDQEYLDKQILFCNNFFSVKLTECWRSLGPLLATVKNKDIYKIASECIAAPNSLAARACNREALGLQTVDKFPFVQDSCAYFSQKQEEYSRCIADVISYVLLTSQSYKKEMSEFCDVVKTESKKYCLEQLDANL